MMKALAIRKLWILLSLISILILLPGGEPVAQDEEEKTADAGEQTALFYPPLPNPPRIQYLATFSSSDDLQIKKEKKSSFADFILGEETEFEIQRIKKPYGVAINQGKIYVTDLRGDGYAIFDLQKRSFNFIHGTGTSELPSPINITIDSDGTKYITDTVKEQVLAFDVNDKFIRAYGTKGQFRPSDVAIDGDKLYIADLDHHSIQVLNKTTGDLVFSFGETGADPGKLFFPTNLAIGSDRFLYISDTGNSRVDKYTLDGQYVSQIGEIGDTPGTFARPKGIALDRDNNLYVVDAAFQNIQVFDSEGQLLLYFGEAARHPSGLDLPTDICIDYDNVSYFQRFADPKFRLDHVILVANQFGPNKVVVYGFGKMDGMSYPEDNL